MPKIVTPFAMAPIYLLMNNCSYQPVRDIMSIAKAVDVSVTMVETGVENNGYVAEYARGMKNVSRSWILPPPNPDLATGFRIAFGYGPELKGLGGCLPGAGVYDMVHDLGSADAFLALAKKIKPEGETVDGHYRSFATLTEPNHPNSGYEFTNIPALTFHEPLPGHRKQRLYANGEVRYDAQAIAEIDARMEVGGTRIIDYTVEESPKYTALVRALKHARERGADAYDATTVFQWLPKYN